MKYAVCQTQTLLPVQKLTKQNTGKAVEKLGATRKTVLHFGFTDQKLAVFLTYPRFVLRLRVIYL